MRARGVAAPELAGGGLGGNFMRSLIVFHVACTLAVSLAAQANSQALPDDLQLLVGKKVFVGRIPLCKPDTYQTNLSYAGQIATVASIKRSTMPKVAPYMMAFMPANARDLIKDTQNGATILFRFNDGTELDTCAPYGPNKLSENVRIAAGETITHPIPPPPPEKQNSAPPVKSIQSCPVLVTRAVSSWGGFGHALVDALTTSRFQQQLDLVTHGGEPKHYLDMRIRNDSQTPVMGIETTAVYYNRIGDQITSSTIIPQNDKPIKPGSELRSYTMDRSALMQNGLGELEVFVSRVRFVDGTTWQDDGSHSCSFKSEIKPSY